MGTDRQAAVRTLVSAYMGQKWRFLRVICDLCDNPIKTFVATKLQKIFLTENMESESDYSATLRKPSSCVIDVKIKDRWRDLDHQAKKGFSYVR